MKGELLMTQEMLTQWNIGQNLDDLMNLDPRGYGVCRILYEASRRYTGEPLSMHAAKALDQLLQPEDLVYILTGFVLLPHKRAEMDGIVGSVMLARALVKAYGIKPMFIVPEECMDAMRGLSRIAGLHFYETIQELKEYPIAMAALPFTKDASAAPAMTEALLDQGLPKAVISIEAPGANRLGVYHNATGKNLSSYEAKTDILFKRLQEKGVWNLAIGDLGNETGMGTLAPQLEKYVPYAGQGACTCGCGGGIAAHTCADNLLTATVSDWGAYALTAALAYLKRDLHIMHDGELQKDAMKEASYRGLVDMYGWLIPAIDGCGSTMNCLLVDLMRQCVARPLELQGVCKEWFERVDALHFYDCKM